MHANDFGTIATSALADDGRLCLPAVSAFGLGDRVANNFLIDLDASVCVSEFSVVALFERIEQVGGGMDLAVVFNLFVTLEVDGRAVLERE